MIYFDNAATTYPKPEVVYKALDEAQRNLAFNAGRGHYDGANNAHDIIEKTRTFLCEKVNCKNLIFTPSATHALNQIIAGIDFMENDVVYCSPYDHNAIARTLHAYSKKYNFTLKLIPLKEDKTVDIEKLKFECMRDRPKAIFCTHVSNVSGYVLPVEKIVKIAKQNDSLFIVDGAQAFGLIDVDLKKDDIDYYVFAGHKTLYGPFGIAGYFTNNNKLNLSFYGGTGSDSLNLEMPEEGSLRFEPSSPNIVAISGLYEAAKWTFSHDALSHERELYKYAVDKLKEIDGIVLYDLDDISLCTGIISFNLEGYNSEELSEILSNDYDICVRGGYHCCPFIHDILGTKDYLGTVRISFNYFNKKAGIDKLNIALEELSYES